LVNGDFLSIPKKMRVFSIFDVLILKITYEEGLMRKLLFLLLMMLIGCVISCAQRDKPQFPDTPKPTGNSNDGKIILFWNVVDDNVSYKIYRSDRADGGYLLIWAGSETTYEDKDVAANETYFYKVTSVNADNRENDLVQSISVTYVPPQPEIRVILSDLRHSIAIANATLEVEGEGFYDTAKTDSSGTFTFKLKHDGIYTIFAYKRGFIPKLHEVDTSQKDEFELSLKPIPKVIGTIKDNAQPFRTPAYIAFSTNGNHAYVTNRYGDNVSVIDVSIDRVLKSVSVGNEPLGLAVNPIKPQLYVVNHEDGTISVIDTGSYRVIGEPIKVGKSPTHATVNSDGTELYVVNSGENSVSIVKLTALPYEFDKIDVGKTPYGITKSVDGRRLFVTNESENTVSIVSLMTKSVEHTISVSKSPKDVASVRTENIVGDYVLVSNHLGKNMAVFHPDEASPRIYELGRLPTGITIVSEPDGSHTAYIALKAESIIKIFDFTTMRVIDESITVGSFPVGIATSPNGDKIYVVNSGEDSVTVLGY